MLLYYCTLFCIDVFCSSEKKKINKKKKKFRFIWPSGFTGEDFLEINQSETRIVCGGHVC